MQIHVNNQIFISDLYMHYSGCLGHKYFQLHTWQKLQ